MDALGPRWNGSSNGKRSNVDLGVGVQRREKVKAYEGRRRMIRGWRPIDCKSFI